MKRKNGFGDGRQSSDLTPVNEEDVKQEEDTVDDGQRPLCKCDFTCFRFEPALPLLDDQSTTGDEKGASNQRVEGINALVQGLTDQVACGKLKNQCIRLIIIYLFRRFLLRALTDKESDQDDGETDKGSRCEHNRVLLSFIQTFVVEDDTGDGQNLHRAKGEDTVVYLCSKFRWVH